MKESGWLDVMQSLRERLTEQHQGREDALSLCRKVIQNSSKSIRNIHRHQFDDAQALLAETKTMVRDMQAALAPFPELAFSGYRSDAEKEFVEANAVFAMVQWMPLPSFESLGVMVSAYLNGMAEASSECRRYVLDLMRHGKMDDAEKLLEVMDEIYAELITFDFPDVLTGGLRRTCDSLRGVLERTRSDLAVTSTQRQLLTALEDVSSKLDK
jgi:translin